MANLRCATWVVRLWDKYRQKTGANSVQKLKKSIKIQSQIDKNQKQIDNKSIKNGWKLNPGAVLGGSGSHLGSKSQNDLKKLLRGPFVDPLWGPSNRAKWVKNGKKTDSKLFKFFDWFLITFLIDFGAIWGAKMDGKSNKNGTKIDQKSDQMDVWF